MGAGAASGALKQSDAAGLIGIGARPQPGVDMGHAFRPAALHRRIEVGVEDAAAAAELQLEAGAFPNVKCRDAEPLNQLAGGEADQIAAHMGALLGRRRIGHRHLLWTSGAGGEKKGRDEDQCTHGPSMAARADTGKLAARESGRYPRSSPDQQDLPMTSKRLDVLAIGNAIVDVIADATDAFLAEQGLTKGSMRLIDEAEAERLYGEMGPGRELSGGSAGNTAAGVAALGARAGFIGQVATDQLGSIYRHDVESLGVDFLVEPRGDVGATARSLILVTPDAQRTMNTFLGAAQQLDRGAIDPAWVGQAKIVYLEGYLWDPEAARGAMEAAIDAAHDGDTQVAFTLSDTFVVDRHRADLLRLIDGRKIHILFANEAELLQLAGHEDFERALDEVAAQVPTLVVTRSERGAAAVRGDERAAVPAEPIEQLVDTTGAGDLFAAGFLVGVARDLSLEESLRLGAIAAAEVIQHYGARPEKDLQALAGDLLG